MDQLLQSIFQTYLVPAVGAIITALVAVLVSRIKSHLNTKDKQAIAEMTVRYIEQVFYQMDGPKKFDKALAEFTQRCEELGIPFTDKEAKIMIESVVAGFNTVSKVEVRAVSSQVLELDKKLTHLLVDSQ